MTSKGFGPGFAKDMAALDRAFARGVLAPSEYRDALRALGVALKDDKDVYPTLGKRLPLDPEPTEVFWSDIDQEEV